MKPFVAPEKAACNLKLRGVALIDLLKKRYVKVLLEDRTLTETYFLHPSWKHFKLCTQALISQDLRYQADPFQLWHVGLRSPNWPWTELQHVAQQTCSRLRIPTLLLSVLGCPASLSRSLSLFLPLSLLPVSLSLSALPLPPTLSPSLFLCLPPTSVSLCSTLFLIYRGFSLEHGFMMFQLWTEENKVVLKLKIKSLSLSLSFPAPCLCLSLSFPPLSLSLSLSLPPLSLSLSLPPSSLSHCVYSPAERCISDISLSNSKQPCSHLQGKSQHPHRQLLHASTFISDNTDSRCCMWDV